MARVCRQMACDMRAEAAMEWPDIVLSGLENITISRLEAARRMDDQADRWQAEIDTGVRNTYDRQLSGAP